MEWIELVMNSIWDWSRTFFGTIFIACVLMSFLLLVIELIFYRIKRKKGSQS